MAKLPKYKISIDPEYSDGEDLGWKDTAFTSRPAIMLKGMAFTSQDPKKEMFFADKLKYRIAAPVLVPMEIYRSDDGEYYVEFTAKEIERIHKKKMKNFVAKSEKFNLEHNGSEEVPAYMLEILLIDSQAKVDMILSDYKVKVPMGTLFMITQITDKEFYHQLVENEQTAYSVEGFFGLSLKDIDEKKNKQNKLNQKEMVKKEELNEGPSAYMELPVGKHEIGGKIYEVVEVIENEGLENEYRHNEIMSIVPVGGAEEAVVEEVEAAEDSKEEDKVEEVEAAEDSKEEEEVKLAEDKKEDKVEEVEAAEDKKEEEVEAQEDEVVESDTYTKAEIDAKFDEVFKMIADLSKDEVVEEVAEEAVELSIHERLSAFTQFSRENKQ